ncbi:hypothetical protein CHU92_13075 [Flavobacterium cyanobacteriorum]|uniref:EamA domain-containing protein n=1 Tax=Flavobacterium cyanobacteriorum TaxID=2022802 RepID=A0A255YVS9_9FLAO|nr:EamA family transporter [Flavobacterium cyanobacteriorum]OYQ33318.1 hypothetical protein CHU92_13075 [Flavobacterium cyanobacteriorum]
MNSYYYIAGTLVFTVYGQIILKWRLNQLGALPAGFQDKAMFLCKALFDPYIISGFISAFTASVFWMAAMTTLEITRAYPFMSLAPALVFVIGVCFLGEAFTIGKIAGLILILLGIIVTVNY